MPRFLVVLAVWLVLPASIYANGESRIEKVGDQFVVHLFGTPHEMGLAHGRLLAKEIRQNIDQLASGVNLMSYAQIGPADFDRLVQRQAAAWPTDRKEEIRGIAEGAGVDLRDIERLNTLQIALPGGIGAAFGKRTLGGRLIQLATLEADSLPPLGSTAIFVYHPKEGLRSAVVAWAGSVAAPVGMNEEGIAVSSLYWPDPKSDIDGLPLPLLARDVLSSAKTLVAATRSLSDAKVAGSWTAVVSDGKIPSSRIVEFSRGLSAELGPNDSAEPNGVTEVLRRSNRPLSKRLADASGGAESPLKAEHLQRRYDDWGAFLSAKSQPVSSLDAVHFLRKSPVAKSVVQQVVLNASDLELWVALRGPGPSPDAAKVFQGYNLRDMLAGRPLAKLVRVDAPNKPLDAKAERRSFADIQPSSRSDESSIPDIYRMDDKPFRVEMSPLGVAGGIVSTLVKIPSPVVTEYPENNTIPAEVFRPRGDGPFPYIIVTHIAGGDFDLSRFVSRTLASNGLACVFIKLPFYGERRPPGKNVRMLAPDVGIASGAMTQAVKDIRRVCDWIQTQPDLDGDKIGICGISLGSITGALATAIEPRISHACLIIGGGSLADLVFESVEGEAREYKKKWTQAGGTRDSLNEIMKPFDPVTYPDRLQKRVVFMINAEQDESVPVKCNKALWEAAGKQQIVWYPCGHYTIVQYLMPALQHTVQFFRAWPTREENVAAK